MRIAWTWSAVALVALTSLCEHVVASGVHVTVRYHHKHKHTASKHTAKETPADTTDEATKLFHVSGSKASFDAMLKSELWKQLDVDVRRIQRSPGGRDTVEADIATTAEAMDKLLKSNDRHKVKGKQRQQSWEIHAKQDTNDGWMTEAEKIDEDRKQVASCLLATKGYTMELERNTLANYVDSDFFKCFRPYDQVYEFFDILTKTNPDILTKIENVSTTYEGRCMHAYKISTSAISPRAVSMDKKALYTQSLLHSREWQAGASHFYAMASLIDGIRQGDDDTLALFDEFDWYFTPIANLDGYIYTWDKRRYWRVNRHPSNGFGGVDLNRNFPPREYWNLDPTDRNAETNPGTAPLSEPETRGIYDFIMKLPKLSGLIDVHAYGGMVLRPFSDAVGEPEDPYKSAMKTLGDAVRDAMNPKGQELYVSQRAGELYPAYGCLDDGIYRMTNFTVPAITIEVEGSDFIAKQSTIVDVGVHMDRGLRAFAEQASSYSEFIEKLRVQ